MIKCKMWWHIAFCGGASKYRSFHSLTCSHTKTVCLNVMPNVIIMLSVVTKNKRTMSVWHEQNDAYK